MPKITLSPEQQAILDYMQNPSSKALAVSARAGTGKTFVITYLAGQLPKRKSEIYCAFNRSIVDEVRPKFEGTSVTPKTFHSMGYGSLKKELRAKDLKPDSNKYREIAEKWLDDNELLRQLITDLVTEDAPEDPVKALRDAFKDVARLCEKLMHFLRVKLIDWEDTAGLQGLIEIYGLNETEFMEIEPEVVRGIPEMMMKAEALLRKDIWLDFTDMIYWVVRWDLKIWQYDRIYVDEAQDLSPMQRSMVKKALRSGGEIIIVGDPKQAIYAFSGADSDSFLLTVQAFNAHILPLTVTRRCGRIIAHHASKLVPDFRALPENERGKIIYIDEDRMAAHAQEGDLIICRTKAPLVAACFELLAENKPATILGSEIGRAFISRLEKIAEQAGYDFAMLEQHLEAAENKEKAKFVKRKDEAGAEGVKDIYEAIRVIISNNTIATSIQDHIDKIDELFKAEARNQTITLCTGHKAKGLEADRVFLLQPQNMPFFHPKMNEESLKQEDNLYYVAITRAKKELVYLINDKWKEKHTIPDYGQTHFDDLDWDPNDITRLLRPGEKASELESTPEPVEEEKPRFSIKPLAVAEHLDPFFAAIQGDFVILNYETTDLDGEPVQIGVIDYTGKELINTYIRPVKRDIDPEAAALHGIAADRVKDAPTFADIYDKLRGALHGKTVVAYNAAFEGKITRLTCQLYDLPIIEPKSWQCAMLMYAAHNPEKLTPWGAKGGWWKLTEALKQEGLTPSSDAHDALADVRMTLQLIQCLQEKLGLTESRSLPAPKVVPAPEAKPIEHKTHHQDPSERLTAIVSQFNLQQVNIMLELLNDRKEELEAEVEHA